MEQQIILMKGLFEMLLTFEMRFTAGHVEFDGPNLSQVTMLMMLICVTVCPETKT